MTKIEAIKLARALREQRPYLLDEDVSNMSCHDQVKYRWVRDTYVNIATALADVVYEATGGLFDRAIFLSNARAVKLPPYKCTSCGQHITDGKPCGHGNREMMGIE